MTRDITAPLRTDIWLVIQENEGLIMEAFTRKTDAVKRAQQLKQRCPSMRTEVAKYLIALNSCQPISPTKGSR